MSMFFKKRSGSKDAKKEPAATKEKAAASTSRNSLSSLTSAASLQRMIGLQGDGAATNAPQPEVLGITSPQTLGEEPRGSRVNDASLGRPRGDTSRGSGRPSVGSQSSLGRDLGRERSLSGSSQSSQVSSENLVREGFLNKKGVINLAYRKRYFVLTTRNLIYFDDKPQNENATPRGRIDLCLISKVDVKSEDQRERFNIHTPARIYMLRADSVADAEAWIAAISGAVEHDKKHHSRPRRRSVSPLDVLKQEAGEFNPDARIHEPADVRSWENWSSYDVLAWLQKDSIKELTLNGFQLHKAGITGKQLGKLQSTDLEKLGITNKEENLRLLAKISSLIKGDIVT